MNTISNRRQPGDRAAGVALVSASALVALTMAHHPSGAHGTGGLAGIVHGAMLILLTVWLFGFSHYALRRNLRHSLVLFGLAAYAVSFIAHLLAATLNGFVVPAMAGHGSDKVGHDMFIFAWETNQAFARIGVFATGAAYVSWGLDLIRRKSAGTMVLGVLGLAAGVAPAALLMNGRAMDVHTALVIYVIHAVWAGLVGVRLITGLPPTKGATDTEIIPG